MVRKYVRYGASPRGAQSLLLGGRVLALLKGRFNVAIEDLKELAPAALRHRMQVNFEGQADGITTDAVVAEVVKNPPRDCVITRPRDQIRVQAASRRSESSSAGHADRCAANRTLRDRARAPASRGTTTRARP